MCKLIEHAADPNNDVWPAAAELPAAASFGPLRAFVARCRTGHCIVTGITIEHAWVLHPQIAAGFQLTPGSTISEPATGCRIAFGRTIAETRAQLAARIEQKGGAAPFMAAIEQARTTILGSAPQGLPPC